MKAFLIPGNGEDLRSRDYQAVLDVYKKLGYQPIFVPITWKYRHISHWIKEAEEKIPKKDLKNSLLSGFSFGSMIALGLAARINPKKLFLYSIPPYFKEDFPIPKKYEEWAGKRRAEKFKSFSFNELTSKTNCPTTLFIGSKELERYPDIMGKRIKEAQKNMQGSNLVIVKGAAHDVGDPAYVKAIEKALS